MNIIWHRNVLKEVNSILAFISHCLFRHWIAFCWCMKIYFSFRCNSYGPWTLTKCDSILIFTFFNNKVCCHIAYSNTKISYLSDFKRTKSKTLRTAKQTEDKLNKSAMWSSANNKNKRLTFLKFDNRKYSNFLLLYKSTCHFRLKSTQERRSSHWYLQFHTRLAERYRWRCADLHRFRSGVLDSAQVSTVKMLKYKRPCSKFGLLW